MKAALLVFLSLVEFRVFVAVPAEHRLELSEAAHHIVEGTPYYVSFQNRLLGPWLVQFGAAATGVSYQSVHDAVLLLLMIGTNLTVFTLVRRLSDSSDLGFRYAVYFLGAFLAIQTGDGAFIWDFIEMPVHLLFAYGVFAGKPVSYFAAVFSIGILNRESALVIPLWLMVDAFTVRAGPQAGRLGWHLEQPARFWSGLLLAAAGGLYTKSARVLLFVRSSMESTNGLIELPFFDNQWNIVASLSRARGALIAPTHDLDVVIHLAWILLAWFFIRHWQRARTYSSLLVVVVALWMAVPVFSYFDETRGYLYLLPYIVMFDLAFRDRMAVPRLR